MKKLLGIVLALTLLLSCTAALADPVKLTYAEVNPLDGTIVGEMAKAFKAKAEELSGGEIEIDIQAGGVLGSEDQILDNLLGGGNITDISRISAFALTQYGCSKASLLSIPYTFVNEEHSGSSLTASWPRNSCSSPRNSAWACAACATAKKASVTSSSRLK